MTPHVASRGRGFTLIEVLISIALLSIAFTLLLSGFRFTLKAWDAGERTSHRMSDLQVVHRVFNNMLSRAFPVAIDDDSGPLFAFEGDSRSLRFAAFLPPYPTAGGLYTIELVLRSEDDNDLLILKRSTFDAEHFFQESPGGEETLLLKTNRDLSFAYFDAKQEEGAWSDHWEEPAQYPRMVKLAFGDDEQFWPDILVPIRIDMDTACIFPDLGRYCRLDQ